MKVIISRKGFDSSNGGCASPIFPDGDMVSLPIPSGRAPTRYGEVNVCGRNLGTVVETLTRGRLTRNATTHLDPDLDQLALPRTQGWRPTFGQTEGQLTHLANCGVQAGDLFLFFGWFREVEERPGGTLTRTPAGQDRHVIFGWLQVDRILDVGSHGAEAVRQTPWLHAHPHVTGEWGRKNAIYVATERLQVPGLPALGALPGGGTFAKFSPGRCLTKAGQSKRSLWSLPARFAPSYGEATLSLHTDPGRWTPDSNPSRVLLDSAKIGQEFVLTTGNTEVMTEWLGEIFASGSREGEQT